MVLNIFFPFKVATDKLYQNILILNLNEFDTATKYFFI